MRKRGFFADLEWDPLGKNRNSSDCNYQSHIFRISRTGFLSPQNLVDTDLFYPITADEDKP